MIRVHRFFNVVLTSAAVAGAAVGAEGPPRPIPPAGNWPAREATRLADPGQPLGAGPQQPAEPAAVVVPPVTIPGPPADGPRSLDD